MNIHDELTKLGFNVNAAPDHPTTGDIQVTIYEKESITLIVEEDLLKQKQMAFLNKAKDPTTGDTTVAQAAAFLEKEIMRMTKGAN